MSRVRTTDRALRNRCFCGREAAGTAVFLSAAIEQRKNRKIRPGGCLHFSGLIFLFLCGESHDRDGAERNRGALRNCGRFPPAYVAKATTEMEQSGIEVRCAIADGKSWRKGPT